MFCRIFFARTRGGSRLLENASDGAEFGPNRSKFISVVYSNNLERDGENRRPFPYTRRGQVGISQIREIRTNFI
jgi:hypothetical protein